MASVKLICPAIVLFSILISGCGTSNKSSVTADSNALEIERRRNQCKVYDSAISKSYEGECKDGLAHGKGTAKGVDHYVGEFYSGTIHGNGVYTWANGTTYNGEWYRGHRNGIGTFVFKRENISVIRTYENVNAGKWVGDKYIVKGIFVNSGFLKDCSGKFSSICDKLEKLSRSSSDNDSARPRAACKVIDQDISANYRGDCRNGLAHGQGLAYDKDAYVGSFVSGKKQGVGAYRWENRNRYEGDWFADLAHGKGIKRWANGDRYDGEWKGDKQHGKGVLTWADGQRYDGEWRDGSKHGKGVSTWKDGSSYSYRGEYRNGLYSGYGVFEKVNFRNQIAYKYSGNWSEGKKHGKGVEIIFESTYRTNWVKGERHGAGTIQDDEGTFRAQWENGTLIWKEETRASSYRTGGFDFNDRARNMGHYTSWTASCKDGGGAFVNVEHKSPNIFSWGGVGFTGATGGADLGIGVEAAMRKACLGRQ